tara:strand:- start:126 stop:2048 length:1923 start_codon:yes stop_codon:yes gene_type:complete
MPETFLRWTVLLLGVGVRGSFLVPAAHGLRVGARVSCVTSSAAASKDTLQQIAVNLHDGAELPVVQELTLQLPALEDGEPPPSALRLVCVSDTHGYEYRDLPRLPPGDVLIHCGDFTGSRSTTAADFDRWLSEQPHAVRIVVRGNHDPSYVLFERSGAHYAVEPSAIVVRGVTFVLMPFQRSVRHAKLPADGHVLISHVPPRGVLDLTYESKHAGSSVLRAAVEQANVKPWLWLCGHIHEARGAARIRFADRRRLECTEHATLVVNCANANAGHAKSITHGATMLNIVGEADEQTVGRREESAGESAGGADARLDLLQPGEVEVIDGEEERWGSALAPLATHPSAPRPNLAAPDLMRNPVTDGTDDEIVVIASGGLVARSSRRATRRSRNAKPRGFAMRPEDERTSQPPTASAAAAAPTAAAAAATAAASAAASATASSATRIASTGAESSASEGAGALLLAIDVGLRNGLALYSGNGSLLRFEYLEAESVAELEERAVGVFASWPAELPEGWGAHGYTRITHVVCEGGDLPLRAAWESEAALHGARYGEVLAHSWRKNLLSKKEQKSGQLAKAAARLIARQLVNDYGAGAAGSHQGKMQTDMAEAILVGYHSIHQLGWLPKQLGRPLVRRYQNGVLMRD